MLLQHPCTSHGQLLNGLHTTIVYQSSYLVHEPSGGKKEGVEFATSFYCMTTVVQILVRFIADLFGTCYLLVTEAGLSDKNNCVGWQQKARWSL